MLKTNVLVFTLLTLSIHQIVGQQNVRSGDSVKSSRSLSNSGEQNQKKLNVADTPDEFLIRKPVMKDKNYNDFYDFLHRRDKAKSKVKREIQFDNSEVEDHHRYKRVLLFRPLFEYRRQEIQRQKYHEKIKTKKPKPTKKYDFGRK